VLGIWYARVRGVDRTGDVFRLPNMLGSCEIQLRPWFWLGDDHGAKSSTSPQPKASEPVQRAIHVVYPGKQAGGSGLRMMAMLCSSFSGAWVGMKMVPQCLRRRGTAIVTRTAVVLRFREGLTRSTPIPRLVTRSPPTYALNTRRTIGVMEAFGSRFCALNKDNRGTVRARGRGDWNRGLAGLQASVLRSDHGFARLQIGERNLPRLGISHR